MAWFVVRYSQDKYNPKENNKTYVGLGDIIKFGRVRFRIRKLCLNYEDESAEMNSELKDFQEYLQKNFQPNSDNRVSSNPAQVQNAPHESARVVQSAAGANSFQSIATDI